MDRVCHRCHCFTVDNKKMALKCTLVPIILIMWMLQNWMLDENPARDEMELDEMASELVSGGSRGRGKPILDVINSSRQLKTVQNKGVPKDIYPPGGAPEFPAFLVNHGGGAEAGSLPRQKDERPAWPAVGWNGYDGPGLDDPNFQKVKFYLYDEGLTDMRAAEECMRRHFKLPSRDSSDPFGELDQRVKVNKREHLAEVFLLPALRKHPMRTMVKAEATLFVIGYARQLARLSVEFGGCRAYNVMSKRQLPSWEDRVADELSRDEYFQRKAGKDFIVIDAIMKPGFKKTKYLSLLQDGPIVATCDRYFPNLNRLLPQKKLNNQLIVVPYVPSTFLDLRYERPPREKTIKFFFRGNMDRENSGRGVLRTLNVSLPGADFKDNSYKGKTAEEFSKTLHATANALRSSDMCLAPEGDTPTTLRLFESLLSGCVPVVSGTPSRTARDLPFPSLINWDEIAFFVHNLTRVAERQADVQKLTSFLERQAGRTQTPETKRRLEVMRTKGMKVYDDYFSYFRNPHGVATALLYEAWVLVQKHGIIPNTIGQLPS